MLSDIRVLELSAPPTMLAGQILGDLGADVVTVEPPGGSAGRRLAPFIEDSPGLERSLTWHALNRNKRGLTLDLKCSDGRAVLAQMLDRFDVIIQWVDGPSPLSGMVLPERLVCCDIRGFSAAGPKSDYLSTDLILTAAGGAPAMAGQPDRPPLFFPVPQAIMEAGAEAAVAALSALAVRDRTDRGQVAEVSARVAAMLSSLGRLVAGRSGDVLAQRATPTPSGDMPRVPAMYECSDGWVIVTVGFIPAFVGMTQRIAEWLAEEGALSLQAAQQDLLAAARSAMSGQGKGEVIAALVDALTKTVKRKTRAEIAEISRAHRFMAAPVMAMEDIAAFEHHQARGLFADQTVDGRGIKVPARFAQFSDYQIEVRRSAPLSEHSAEILAAEARLSGLEIQALFAEGVI